MTTVKGTTLTVPTQDGVADAYVSRPDDNAPHPGVVFYTDIFGLRPSTMRMADRVASAGYTVLVPNVFYRSGPPPTVSDMPDYVDSPDMLWDVALKAFPITRATSDEEAMRDALVWLDWLAADPLTADGPVGITGYCHGGMLAVRTAGTYPDRVGAAAIIHGSGLITDEPDSPHVVAERIKAEMFLAHGAADTFATPEQAKQFEEVLTAAGVRFRSEMYPNCQHGWTAKDTFVYDEAGDEGHWAGMLDLFARAL